MDIRGFPRDETLEQLASLTERQRAAYAVACAERLLPLYQWFEQVESWGDVTVLERGIGLVWDWVKGAPAEEVRLTAAERECEHASPDLDDFESPLASRALDAGAAVIQALRASRRPQPGTVADAGEIAWECAFGIEQSRLLEAGVVHVADTRVLARAASGGLVLLEEDLQRRSLEFLHQASADQKIDHFRKEFAHLA